jgi:undecaprenyl-diphosphatase
LNPASQIPLSMLLVGFVSAFISGFIACKWMLQLVKRGKLTYFAIYCFAVGAVSIVSSL